MRFRELTRSAQLYIASICCLALVQAALASSQTTTGAPLQLFTLLVLAATIAHSFPVSTPGKQAYHVSLPFFVAAIILLSPLQLIGLVVVVHLGETVRRRRSTVAQIFNAAAYACTGLAAQAAYRALWPGQAEVAVDLSQPTCLAAGLAAASMFAILNRVLVSLAIWLGSGISLRSQRMFAVEGLLTDGVLLLMGVPLAHLAQLAPWAAAVGAAPLWLIHRVLDLPNLRAQSRQDGLTELFTAPYLTETCTRELNRGRRFNRPVSLLLLDIDRLGELNAAHGHQTGDAVLRATARTISQALREYDLPARLAGGLFAVLLPETDLAPAQVVAERIRRATAEQRHEIPNSVELTNVTLSVGGAIVNGQNATATQLFEAARSALARAKQSGGNQIGFESVQAALLTSVPTDTMAADEATAAPLSPMLPHRRGSRGLVSTWLREHRHTAVLCGLATLGLGGCVVGAIAELDWALLVVMLSLSALAGLAFYFKSLPLALALAGELNRSPARLMITRYARMWPQYAALAIAGLLMFSAYDRLGLTGAIGIAAAALIVRHLAGRYVDRTMDSVRKLRTTNEALEHQAFHDPLTGLANRALFAERLEHAMVRAGDRSVAVLFPDLDNFKTVNDTLGHAAGDALLVAATARLLQCVRREDTIARLGGDEFTVLLEEMRDPSDAARMAERISEVLSTPFELDGQQALVSSSIGIALDTDRSHRPDDLLREADLAMYRAKSGGKARYEIFDPGMAERAMGRLELEIELRQAVARDELELRYRPIVSLASGELEAVEAELRWQHPRRGLLQPGEFMRVAEESGIILDLGRWAVQQACRDARAWQGFRRGVVVQVDLSPRQLEQPEVAEMIGEALAASGLSPECLRLEIPESAVALDGVAVARALEPLNQIGVRLALDNVGAGLSSLAWLGSLPVDVLKIDPGVSLNGSAGLVRATVALGVALGMRVTVQGVEQADQAAGLAALGCTHAQGTLYGPPLSTEAVGRLLTCPPLQRRAA
jgi:diguanylate cyclase (GGDEF)-like protein